MRTIFGAIAAVAALFFAVPAEAAIVVTEYHIDGLDAGGNFRGSLFLNYDTNTSQYNFNSIQTLGDLFSWNWNGFGIDIFPFGSEGELQMFGSLDGPAIAPYGDDFYFVFDPSLSMQTVSFVSSSHGPLYALTSGITLTRVSGAVPEPATWTMMLLGFGAVGFGMRRHRRSSLPQMA